MDRANFYAAVVALLFSIYALKVCVRHFQRSSQSKTLTLYLYGVGAAISCGLIVMSLFRVFIAVFRPFP